ncbi:MAG TPA: M23 family metallopeptidase, partial [Gemmatimonadales bacterium]|nr:M23 family metallopeptidase [Gemmatimonadales bacterium]
MDHLRRGSHRAGVVPAAIDLGNDPPLSVDGETGGGVDRRRVSVQWFSGTILTGLCGAALMGGAVFAALDGETHFAATPERFEVALRGTGERNLTRKSDRLPPVGEANAARQTIRVSTVNRVGDREVVRVRPFMRVAANLSLATSELSANIPPFNPQRMLAESSVAGSSDDAVGAEPDAEVSFVTRDLAALLPRVKIAALVPIEDVISRVRDAANWTGSTQPARYMVASVQPTAKFSYANEGGGDDLYAGIAARGVPENFTLLPKTTSQATGGTNSNERTITVKKGESVSTILREAGATPDEIKAIAGQLGAKGRDGGLKEGQKIRLLLSPIPGGQRMQPVRLILIGDTAVEAVVALSDMGKYVSVDVQSAETTVADNDDDDDDGSGVRLYQSIYETALRNQIPRPVIEELVRIYSYDVDFQRKAQPGDSFEVLYAGEDETPIADSKNDVLFASLTVGGETKKFYRFQSTDDGVVDYYDETGKSAKKFLVRKPLAQGIMRSGFGARKHPLLGYTRAHTGVDWAAPMGTPIYASGNGVVEKVGWEGGYGKYIRIRHANGYETAYGHMTAYARGMDPGVRVRQGQVIGFVGSTGLSTGAHLHYEIVINSRFVDPMKVKLPRGRVLDGPSLAAFDGER